MKIAFKRCMTQRYRAILHLVDPIIAAGHELWICVSNVGVDIEQFRLQPCDVDKSSKNTCEYLLKCFGIKCKHFDKIIFTTERQMSADLKLCYDDHNKNVLGIPYNTNCCHLKNGKKVLVGNPMCEEIRSREKIKDGTALVVHPGGGRGYISPQRKQLKKEKVTENNIKFLQMALDNLPETVNKVTIKTHPFPYRRCTPNALKKFVIPELKFSGKIVVRDDDMIGLLATHEYIINWGGSTALWMMGSWRKWVNIEGMDWYKANREKLLEQRGGGISIKEFKNYLHILGQDPLKTEGYNMSAKKNIMKVINEALDNSSISK